MPETTSEVRGMKSEARKAQEPLVVLQNTFEPKIVAFFCNWCTYLAADLAGTSRVKYAPNIRVIRTMCSRSEHCHPDVQ